MAPTRASSPPAQEIFAETASITQVGVCSHDLSTPLSLRMYRPLGVNGYIEPEPELLYSFPTQPDIVTYGWCRSDPMIILN